MNVLQHDIYGNLWVYPKTWAKTWLLDIYMVRIIYDFRGLLFREQENINLSDQATSIERSCRQQSKTWGNPLEEEMNSPHDINAAASQTLCPGIYDHPWRVCKNGSFQALQLCKTYLFSKIPTGQAFSDFNNRSQRVRAFPLRRVEYFTTVLYIYKSNPLPKGPILQWIWRALCMFHADGGMSPAVCFGFKCDFHFTSDQACSSFWIAEASSLAFASPLGPWSSCTASKYCGE